MLEGSVRFNFTFFNSVSILGEIITYSVCPYSGIFAFYDHLGHVSVVNTKGWVCKQIALGTYIL